MPTTSILLVDEPGQADLVKEYLASCEVAPHIITIDFWAERALRERGIESSPLTDYVQTGEDFMPLMRRSQELAREWYRLPDMAFFKEGSIAFGEALEPAVDYYLKRVLYLAIVVERILAQNEGCTELIVMHSQQRTSIAAGPLSWFELSALADAARFVTGRAGVPIRFLGEVQSQPTQLYPHSRFPFLLRCYNLIVKTITRPRAIRIYASEYWRNVSPFLPQMPDAELVLMDRGEVRKIPWRSLLSFRVRLMHPLDEMDGETRNCAHAEALKIKDEWQKVKKTVAQIPGFSARGVDEWGLLAPAFSFLVEHYSERMIADVLAFKRVLIRERINRVLLRASMSARQTHFFCLAQLARELKIPSIELQHAGEMSDPDNAQSRLSTDYLAAYGPKTRDIYIRNHGYSTKRLRLIGSPRFDAQAATAPLAADERARILTALRLDPSRPVMLIAAPALLDSFPAGPTSYETVAMLESWKRVQEGAPGLQIIFKFRAGNSTPACRAFLQEIFHKDVAFAEYEAPFPLMQASDIVLSGASTMFLEALIAHRPALIFPIRFSDVEFLESYGEAVLASHSLEECITLVRRLVEDTVFYQNTVSRGALFLQEGQRFDGHASERLVALLREPLKSVE